MAAARPTRTASALWLGTSVALLSALTFALNVALAGVVYAEGGNVQAVNLVRPPCFALALWLLLRARGATLLPAPARRVPALVVGVLMTGLMYALLGTVVYLPVGLAVLLMYLAPLILAVMTWLDGSEQPHLDRLLAMLVVLAGLALALEVGGDLPDWRGLGLGLLTACLFALLLWFSGRSMAGEDRRRVMFYAMLTSSVLVVLVSVTGFAPAWPASTTGWLALAATTLMFIIATFTLFTAVALLGPLRTAVVDTTSPVWGMAFGWLLLGELLGALQFLGAGLVVAGVLYVQLREVRALRSPPPE